MRAYPDFSNRCRSQFYRIKIAQVNYCIEYCAPRIYCMGCESMIVIMLKTHFLHTFCCWLYISNGATQIACTLEAGKQPCNIIHIFSNQMRIEITSTVFCYNIFDQMPNYVLSPPSSIIEKVSLPMALPARLNF